MVGMRRSGPDTDWEAYGVMTIDPGGTTGVAFGVLDLSLDSLTTVKEILEDARVWTDEVEGSYEEQAMVLFDLLLAWVHNEGLASYEVVIEGFALRTQNADLSPVEVTAGLVTLFAREGVRDLVSYQDPGNAKQMVTLKRLSTFGLEGFRRGLAGRVSDHRTDALRHLALRVMRLVEMRS